MFPSVGMLVLRSTVTSDAGAFGVFFVVLTAVIDIHNIGITNKWDIKLRCNNNKNK